LTALLDTGASATLIAEKFTKKLKLRSKKSNQVWTTPAGTLQTTAMCRSQFSMPELHDNRVIEWEFHVTKTMGAYDMILGRDLLTDLGIDVKCSNMTVSWDHADIPWKDMTQDMEENFHINEPEAVEEEMSRIRKILDNDYGKADLKDVAEMQTHLSQDERDKLEKLLNKYDDLFDGTLGRWTHPDYKLELKPDVKPYHAKAFPVPKVHMETLKKEVERLCKVGVLTRVNRSECRQHPHLSYLRRMVKLGSFRTFENLTRG
jgi:gag-polyprotein putative aspartyl protease